MSDTREERQDELQEILRGELAAIETYKQVQEKIEEYPENVRLSEFQRDHEKAATFWKTQLKFMDSKPTQKSGAWGTVAKTVVGVAKLAGNTAALKAMKEGEEHGLKEYESLLKKDEITPFQKTIIKNEFIPTQKKHIESINAMMKIQ